MCKVLHVWLQLIIRVSLMRGCVWKYACVSKGEVNNQTDKGLYVRVVYPISVYRIVCFLFLPLSSPPFYCNIFFLLHFIPKNVFSDTVLSFCDCAKKKQPSAEKRVLFTGQKCGMKGGNERTTTN